MGNDLLWYADTVFPGFSTSKEDFKKEQPMKKNYPVSPDVEIIAAHFPIPGAGFLPVNAFVIKAKEPILIDTGMGIDSDAFMQALESIIDLKDLRWIWLTHDDADHTGSILKILEAQGPARGKLIGNNADEFRRRDSHAESLLDKSG